MKALLLKGKGLADGMKVGAISFAHPLSFHQVALGSVHQSNNPT
ncbi:hypothetical protein [Paenibacillus brevis]|nr:hypothetical protein [Paenibacillus brevis]